MSDEQKVTENEVFDQELSLDDLDAAAGGFYEAASAFAGAISPGKKDADTTNCDNYDIRQIYGGGGFPNCAATVEDGSWCRSSDACFGSAVDYKGMKSCSKAWR